MSGIYREDQGEKIQKVKERQVRKQNNLVNKKEGGITWQSSQVFPAARAFCQANNRQVTPAVRASQATNNSQAGRLTYRASPQASQEDSTLPQSTIYQAGNPQGLQADGTPSQARSAISQAGSPQSSQAVSSQLSLGDSTLPQSDLSQAGSSQASPVDSTLSPAESELSQGSNFQSSLEDSALPQSNVSQAGNSQASPGESTSSLVASELSHASSPPLPWRTALFWQRVLYLPIQSSTQLGLGQGRQVLPQGRTVWSLSLTALFPKGYLPRTMLCKKQGPSPIGTAPHRFLPL